MSQDTHCPLDAIRNTFWIQAHWPARESKGTREVMTSLKNRKQQQSYRIVVEYDRVMKLINMSNGQERELLEAVEITIYGNNFNNR